MTGTNLGDVVDRAADPGALALIDLRDADAPVSWSHGEIDRAASGVARALAARGLGRGDRVAILSANRAEYLLAFLGIMRAGMVAVPVSFKLPRPAVEFVLRDAGAALLFCDAERRPAVPADLPAVEFGGDFDAFVNHGPFDVVAPAAAEIAMILYTSGSTGRPKGVRLCHEGQRWAIDHRLALTPGLGRHRLLVAAPLFHMNALCVSLFALAGHASTVLLPQFSAPAYIEAIARHRCTWLTSVPTMMARVAQERDRLAGADLSSVERVSMGSAPLTQSLIDRVKALFPEAAVGNGYGTTETGPVAFGPHPDGRPQPEIALGYPARDISARLVDGTDMDAAEGVLHLRTPALMRGYHNLPEKTAEVMTADGYYVTGDVMRRDADGWLFFHDRSVDVIKHKGY